ncbi:hypothetical protein ATE84_4103 [Aquimarina sp. MAR_2010_214]|uniref:hypothetical protein n=1 Tax=Aquimarina sp. MAR_2010_214 TaxID=1250026 RepID=UPI000C714994|nr:hypothetical protein [Aquimarina sp. MAR_2010_214]PKV52002.1 hypothetical protein ATE84_4103 [Aquimarina sp. MAR_2010_214]
MKKNNLLSLTVCLLFCFNSFSFDKSTKKLNKALYEFFLNLELTKRNNEILGIYDYIPNLKSRKKIETIVFDACLNGSFREKVLFNYQNNILSKIEYRIKRSDVDDYINFNYKLSYIEEKLSGVYIKNRLLYKFNYNSLGSLKEVKYFLKNNIVKVYNIKYDYERSKIKFSLDVIKNLNVYFDINKSKDFLIWDKNHNLKKFSFDIFSYEDIEYSNLNDIKSIKYSTISDKNKLFTWSYIKFDERKNWTQRESKEYRVNRIINYK